VEEPVTTGAPGDATSGIISTTADVVRDAIARCALAEDAARLPDIPERHGTITLRPHQIDAAARLARLLGESGGALLADEVGLGKTYVALALAHDARDPLIVAPAALLPMWRSALERVRRSATLVSFERLSRSGHRSSAARTEEGGTRREQASQPLSSLLPPRSSDPDLIIVDEAHHVRTQATRRYAALADLCARSRVLLLSATPLQNSRRDLAAQLALFLGSAAWTMSDAELARFVVRRTRQDVRPEQAELPTVGVPTWIELPSSDDCLDALLGLPPPIPAADGGDGGALLVYSLVRRWASSRAALCATLRRRLARAAALIAALAAGRYPSRSEIAAWTYADGVVQLAFPELVAAEGNEKRTSETRVSELLIAVRTHEAAVRQVLCSLDRTPDPDVERAQAIREIRSRHLGERVIAFAEAAETVEAMFRQLRGDPRAAMLRARGAAVSGGALSRREALARFAPAAQGAPEPHASQRIDLLLTTDLLSEGVNLQDASVVVHLDLPWNPARLEQRVGRVSRIGSSHARVSVYAIRPPAASERLLAVEERLRAKLATAGRALGVVGTILPGLNGASGHGAAEEWTHVHTLLRRWRTASPARSPPRTGDAAVGENEGVQVAAARSTTAGFIAAIVEHGRPILLASTGNAEPSTSPHAVAAAMELASGGDVRVDDRALARTTDVIDGWLSRRAASEMSGVDVAAVARARRRVLARISRIAVRAPRHLRSVVASLAAEARRAALMPLAEGAERVLAELADAPLADQAWLRAIAAFGDVHARPGEHGAREPQHAARRLVALLLLQGPSGE
jgi:superfamily II DNA or RNA helicase